MGTTYSITDKFGKALAQRLADSITVVLPGFPATKFVKDVALSVPDRSYTQRVELIADKLHQYLPQNYPEAVAALLQVLGPPNPHETGMFTQYYWIMPIGKFVEKYGLEHFAVSMDAIGEITKRNTGEYAVRPYIRKYPEKSLKRMAKWARSKDFHLRRLASEGLRPKLPWAPKLDIFQNNPQPVFDVLHLLKEDDIKFVKRSVANHLTDWLKVNKPAVSALIKSWAQSTNPHTRWIVQHATRKIKVD